MCRWPSVFLLRSYAGHHARWSRFRRWRAPVDLHLNASRHNHVEALASQSYSEVDVKIRVRCDAKILCELGHAGLQGSDRNSPASAAVGARDDKAAHVHPLVRVI